LTLAQNQTDSTLITWKAKNDETAFKQSFECVLDGEQHSHNIEAEVSYSAEVKTAYDQVSKKVMLTLSSASAQVSNLQPRQNPLYPSLAFAVFVQSNTAALQTHLQTLFSEASSDFFEMSEQIDIMVVNSLLFDQGLQHITYHDAHLPKDLALFGQIKSPFTITSQDHLMGHGATHSFEVSAQFTGKVKWSIKPLPGSTSAIGTINADTGLYTSPAKDQIVGTFTRVIVTATDTNSAFSSSSLVTVVVRDITVNPLVQICNASPEAPGTPNTRTLSANTLGEGVLEWRVTKGSGTIPSRAADGKNTYTAGPKNPALEGSFTVDEIEVKNLATGKTQQAYVLVIHFPQELTITPDMELSSFPEGKAKLKVTDSRDRPVTAELQVIAGNGSVDSSGNYTSDPASPHRFALVKATKDEKDGWILLPCPLVKLPDKPIDDLENY
jgi:hypothetical protein